MPSPDSWGHVPGEKLADAPFVPRAHVNEIMAFVRPLIQPAAIVQSGWSRIPVGAAMLRQEAIGCQQIAMGPDGVMTPEMGSRMLDLLATTLALYAWSRGMTVDRASDEVTNFVSDRLLPHFCVMTLAHDECNAILGPLGHETAIAIGMMDIVGRKNGSSNIPPDSPPIEAALLGSMEAIIAAIYELRFRRHMLVRRAREIYEVARQQPMTMVLDVQVLGAAPTAETRHVNVAPGVDGMLLSFDNGFARLRVPVGPLIAYLEPFMAEGVENAGRLPVAIARVCGMGIEKIEQMPHQISFSRN